MRSHQAVRTAVPLESRSSRPQQLKEVQAVELVLVQRSSENGASGRVEEAVGEVATRQTRQGGSKVNAAAPAE